MGYFGPREVWDSTEHEAVGVMAQVSPLISVTVSLGPCHNVLLKCNSRRGQVPLQIMMAFSLVRKLVDWTYSSFFSATKNLQMKLKV